MKTGLASAPARGLILCLGVALLIPSIGARLVLDDHLQSVMRMKVPPVEGILLDLGLRGHHDHIEPFGAARPFGDTGAQRGTSATQPCPAVP